MSFTTHSNGRQTGFIADIFRLLGKYQLRHVVETYLESSIFPSKFAWKRILKSTLHESAISSWHNRIQTQDCSRFTALHYDYSPHLFQITLIILKLLTFVINITNQ